MINGKVISLLIAGLILQSCCNCKDTVQEIFRYESVGMQEVTSSDPPEGARFSVFFEQEAFSPAVLRSAAGMLRMEPCDCLELGLENTLTHIRFIQTDTMGQALGDISHRFEGQNHYGVSGPSYKSLPVLIAEFRTVFSYYDDLQNSITFRDKERSATSPVLFYAEFEFNDGQVLKTDIFTSL